MFRSIASFIPLRQWQIRTVVLPGVLIALLCWGCQEAGVKLGDRAIAFEDVTSRAGLADFKHASGATGDKWFPEIMGAGGGFIDFDGDGWQDILLVGGATWQNNNVPAVALYKNRGNGTFADYTSSAGLADVRAYGFGITVGDVDNDFDEDFVLTTLDENLLFINENGGFTPTILDTTKAWSTASLMFDADNDGWLDILAGNYVAWSPATDRACTLDRTAKEYCTPELYTGVGLHYYRNDGTGRFQRAEKAAGFAGHPGKTLGMTTLDYNGDGALDVVVTNDTARDLLFENRGDGTFEEKGLVSGMALTGTGKASAGMGVDTGDINGSGDPAIVIGNFSKEMISVFQYRGNSRFRDMAIGSGIGRPSLLPLTFGIFLFDIELDGDLDLFALNGHVHEGVGRMQEGITFAQKPLLFTNRGDGTFEEVPASTSPMLDQAVVGRGAAYADYDNDGDLDVLLTTNNGPAYLWQNESQTGAVLQVSLEGVASNPDAIGARVTLVTAGKKQVRYIASGASYLSAVERRLTFGLGTEVGIEDRVDSLFVRWPSGGTDTLTTVPSGAHIRIREKQGIIETVRSY